MQTRRHIGSAGASRSRIELNRMKPEKDCPCCGETILAVAIRCKHCQADLRADDRPPTTDDRSEIKTRKSELLTFDSRLPILASDEIAHVLRLLVDRSLVSFDAESERYRLLESVHQFAHEHLEAGEASESLRSRHAAYFGDLAERSQVHLRGPRQAEWFERLDREHDNVRSALEWSSRIADDAEACLRMCGNLSSYWYHRGYSTEGSEWCLAALSHREASKYPRERAQSLVGLASFAFALGDFESSARYTREAREIARELGDRKAEARAMFGVAMAEFNTGNLDAARLLCEETLVLTRELGDRSGEASTLSCLGAILRDLGEYEEAKTVLDFSLNISRALGYRKLEGVITFQLGSVAANRQDPISARPLLEESLTILREVGEQTISVEVMNWLAATLLDCGEIEKAKQLLDESFVASRVTGNRLQEASCEQRKGQLAVLKNDLPAAAESFRRSLALCFEIRSQWNLVECLQRLAETEAGLGEYLRSARLFGAVEGLRRTLRIRAFDDSSPHPALTAAKARLGEDRFASAREEGREMTVEEAVAFALEDAGPATGAGL